MIFQELLDLNSYMDMIPDVKFINDQIPSSETDLERILLETTTIYNNREGDVNISLLPKCSCGYLHFRDAHKYVCPYCNTRPVSQIDSMVQSTLWFRKPQGIASLINPMVYHMLERRFKSLGWSAIAYLTDPTYRPPNKVPRWLSVLEGQKFDRSWNYFIVNFDRILNFLFTMTEFRVSVGEVDYLQYVLHRDAGKIFCDYIPIPNPIMFPHEKTNFCIYRSKSSGLASSFIQAMLSIDSPIQELSLRQREIRLSKMYRSLVSYQHHHIRDEVSPKEGEVRRHSMGSKAVVSGRAIIISGTGPLDHEEIGIPWFMMLGAFRPVFVNKLSAKGWNLNRIVNHLRSSTTIYCPILRDCMCEMIEECPDGNLWTLVDRNPSIKHGSIAQMKVKPKFNTSDYCITLPIPNIKPHNADFDGDQMAVTFHLDGYLVAKTDTFLPWSNVYELTTPFKMSKNTFVSAPQISTYAGYLRKSRSLLNGNT